MISLFLASVSLFYYVNVPFVTMREHPRKDSEVVSQAYFSEEVKIIEETSQWKKIETVDDAYQGWIEQGQLCERNIPFLTSSSHAIAKINRCMAHLYHVEDTVYGPILTLPFDSKLEVLSLPEDRNKRWIKVALVDGREGFIQRGDITIEPSAISLEELPSFSLQFLDLPYTWGGRSSFGYDCSGFVQMLYRQMGIFLPRDSKDQINWEGFEPVSIDGLSKGDLIFFGSNPQAIRHVGMYLGFNQFIHATVAENAPYIHISSLSDSEWNGEGKWKYVTARKVKKNNQDFRF